MNRSAVVQQHGAERFESSRLGADVDGLQVEVNAILESLLFGNFLNDQHRTPTWILERTVRTGCPQQFETQRRSPELSKRIGMVAINDNLADARHGPNLPHQNAHPLVTPFGYASPMTRRQLVLDTHRDEIIGIVRDHRGVNVSLFGSMARGDDTETSDVDLLVEFEPNSSLFDLMDIQHSVESLLGISVDVVSVGGLKPRDSHILNEAVPLDARRPTETPRHS